MPKFFALILICSLVSAQSRPRISNEWFLLDWGTSSQNSLACQSPAAVVVNNPNPGLIINVTNQSVVCGNATQGLTSLPYRSGLMFWNYRSMRYGILHTQIAFPTTVADGTNAAIWLLGLTNSSGANCQLLFKTTLLSSSNCLPGPTGYTEIDWGEILNSRIHINQSTWAGSSTSRNTATVGDVATLHDMVLNWQPTFVDFYVDHVLTFHQTTFVPQVAMYFLIQTGVNNSNGTPDPSQYPSSLTMPFFRACAANLADPDTCTKAAAQAAQAACMGDVTCTGFDEEWDGTDAQADIYIAQNYTGLQTGLSCADAVGILNNTQVTYPNDPAFWASGIIGPGTTLHLCGNITTAVIAQGSGTSNNPITVHWESGSCGTFSANGNTFINVTGSPCGGTYLSPKTYTGPNVFMQ